MIRKNVSQRIFLPIEIEDFHMIREIFLFRNKIRDFDFQNLELEKLQLE